MATSNPQVKNVGITYKVSLRDYAVPGSFKSAPTLAVGDVKVNTDSAGLTNVGTLPTASGIEVTGVLSAAEMNGDHIWLQFIDQTSPKEWSDLSFWIPTTAFAQASVDASGRIDLGKWVGNPPDALSSGKVPSDIKLWLTSAPNALQSGRVDSYIGAVASGVIAAASFASGALDAVWSTTTRLLTAGTNIVLAKGTGVTGLNDLDASGVRTAVGLGSANLDTQLGAIKTDVDAIPTTKTGYALTAAYDPAKTAAQAGDAMALTSGERTTLTAAIWAALTSGLTTVGSIGKLLVDNINATISSRLAGSSYTAPDNSSITAIKTKTDQLAFTVANQVDANALSGGGGDPSSIADAVWDELLSGHVISGSAGAALAAAAAGGSSITTDDILQMVFEGTENFQDFLRLARAVLYGASTGQPDAPIYFGLNGTDERVTADVSAHGNRSNVQLDPS